MGFVYFAYLRINAKGGFARGFLFKDLMGMQLAVLARVFYVLAKMEKDDVYIDVVNHCTSLKVKRHRIRNRVSFRLVRLFFSKD